MKTKLNLTPLALESGELRSSSAFQKRARRFAPQLDSGLIQLLRELAWRRLLSDPECEALVRLLTMLLNSRKVALSERVHAIDDLSMEEKENALLELFGDFPPVRPFSENPPGAIIGEDPLDLLPPPPEQQP
jgi:hypothetical protein